MAGDFVEFLGDPYCNVWPLDPIETAEYAAVEAAVESSPPQCNTFLIRITAKFTRPLCNSDDEEEDYESLLSGAEGASITFSHTYTLPFAELMGREARDNVAGILSDIHVPPTHRFIVDKILDTGRKIANNRPENLRVISMYVKIDAFVDELPVPAEDDYFMEDDGEGDDGDGYGDEDDDYDVRFVPASKESIEALREMRVLQLSEKSATCPVCLDDVLVGFEAIRLPCSHLYHGECIVKWLETSKFCPLCRFEMS